MYTLRYSFCLILLVVFGCQPQTDPVSPDASTFTDRQPASAAPAATEIRLRLKQMVVSGNTSGLGPAYQTKRFEYAQGRNLRLAFITPNSPNPAELTNEYRYDEQGRVSSYLVRYPQTGSDGTVGERHTFSYGQNAVDYSFMRIGADGQGLPSQVNTQRDQYRINSVGELTEWIQEGIIRYGRPTKARYVYSYQNGNIVKATYLNEGDVAEFSIRYAYDDKVNPFYGWMFTIDPVLRYSRNNVVSAQVDASTPSRTEYTYNEQGLPLTKKDVSQGALLTYEYESF